MKKNTSENMAEVATLSQFRLPLNIQLFAGEDSEDVDDIQDEFSNMNDENEEQSIDENEENTDLEEGEKNSDTADQKPDRDLEKDAAFAEMRRKTQEAEAKLKQVEIQRQNEMEIARKYGAYGVFSDEDVSKMYGQTHNLHTLEQLGREIQRQEYVKQGVDPDLVEKIVQQSIDNHPAIAQAKQANAEQKLMTNYLELTTEFPDLVKSPDDIKPEVWQKWNNGDTGLSLADAFSLVNRKTISEKQQAANIQAAKNQLSSKSHLKPNGSGGSELDLESIPDDILRNYRKMFPKGNDKDFIKDYKKNNKK